MYKMRYLIETKAKTLGKGQYGEVFQAIDTTKPEGDVNRTVAVKMFTSQNDLHRTGIPAVVLRQGVFLKNMNHDNVLKVFDVIFDLDVRNGEHTCAVVTELCNENLMQYYFRLHANFRRFLTINRIFDDELLCDEDDDQNNIVNVLFAQECEEKVVLFESTVKNIMKHILRGVNHMHQKNIIHRDLKPQNILVKYQSGVQGAFVVKIADFDLVRRVAAFSQSLTPDMVTITYRAPEIMFGEEYYTSASDLWSVGCIFYELLTNKNLYFITEDKNTAIGVLSVMLDTLGTPDAKQHPYLYSLFENNGLFVKCKRKAWQNEKTVGQHLLGDEDNIACRNSCAQDLLSKLMCYEPSKRITAAEALQHPYFGI